MKWSINRGDHLKRKIDIPVIPNKNIEGNISNVKESMTSALNCEMVVIVTLTNYTILWGHLVCGH